MPNVLDNFFERSRVTRGSVREYTPKTGFVRFSKKTLQALDDEKPLTINLNDADRIIDISNA